jgi:hypothetical protein
VTEDKIIEDVEISIFIAATAVEVYTQRLKI